MPGPLIVGDLGPKGYGLQWAIRAIVDPAAAAPSSGHVRMGKDVHRLVHARKAPYTLFCLNQGKKDNNSALLVNML